MIILPNIMKKVVAGALSYICREGLTLGSQASPVLPFALSFSDFSALDIALVALFGDWLCQ